MTKNWAKVAERLKGYRFLRCGLGEIAVSETFKSFQGEGPSAGRPAIFLRLQGCNLSCVWCDTIDIWVKGHVYSYEDLLDLWEARGWIDDLRNDHMLVMTGGEPMLRQREIEGLLRIFVERYRFKPRIEVETNGTIPPSQEIERYVDQFNVSPKLSNSGMPRTIRFRRDVLRRFVETGKAIFKFVVVGERDIEEVMEYIDAIPIPPERVYLMPESKTREEYMDRLGIVEDLCKKHGFKLSPRLHLLYGWR
ncbi:QueE [Desulfurococcaceae archaeon AG1]|nr:QueE [Desulfurococcaceae archaeon AG1]